ncbi:hypothetical protein ADUPG1_008053 [Aduncisulcus paluster]|uniref:C2 domain-containing protein n=1 Tax=Aduncisulcus paluster TaxID=2918883 RepID=A0ABQ5KQJ3_9EUKA|nr:hypothetical protein ADUPG1_008053 [Aduncisulcus paluster]
MPAKDTKHKFRVRSQVAVSFKVVFEKFYAKNLPAMDRGSSDPFFRMAFDHDFKHWTSPTIERNLNPKWEDRLEFVYSTHYAKVLSLKKVSFKFYDRDVGADDFMGAAEINMELLAGGHKYYVLQLKDNEGNARGEFGFKCSFQHQSEIQAMFFDECITLTPPRMGEDFDFPRSLLFKINLLYGKSIETTVREVKVDELPEERMEHGAILIKEPDFVLPAISCFLVNHQLGDAKIILEVWGKLGCCGSLERLAYFPIPLIGREFVRGSRVVGDEPTQQQFMRNVQGEFCVRDGKADGLKITFGGRLEVHNAPLSPRGVVMASLALQMRERGEAELRTNEKGKMELVFAQKDERKAIKKVLHLHKAVSALSGMLLKIEKKKDGVKQDDDSSTSSETDFALAVPTKAG